VTSVEETSDFRVVVVLETVGNKKISAVVRGRRPQKMRSAMIQFGGASPSDREMTPLVRLSSEVI